MEAGVSENNIVIIGIMVFLVKLIVPVATTKITNSMKSMDVYMQCIPYRYLKFLNKYFYKIYTLLFILQWQLMIMNVFQPFKTLSYKIIPNIINIEYLNQIFNYNNSITTIYIKSDQNNFEFKKFKKNSYINISDCCMV